MSENLNLSSQGEKEKVGSSKDIPNEALKSKLEQLKKIPNKHSDQKPRSKEYNKHNNSAEQVVKTEEGQTLIKRFSEELKRLFVLFVYITKILTTSIIGPEDSSGDMYSLQKNLNEQIKNSSKN